MSTTDVNMLAAAGKKAMGMSASMHAPGNSPTVPRKMPFRAKSVPLHSPKTTPEFKITGIGEDAKPAALANTSSARTSQPREFPATLADGAKGKLHGPGVTAPATNSEPFINANMPAALNPDKSLIDQITSRPATEADDAILADMHPAPLVYKKHATETEPAKAVTFLPATAEKGPELIERDINAPAEAPGPKLRGNPDALRVS